jgi:hypothetical protein
LFMKFAEEKAHGITTGAFLSLGEELHWCRGKGCFSDNGKICFGFYLVFLFSELHWRFLSCCLAWQTIMFMETLLGFNTEVALFSGLPTEKINQVKFNFFITDFSIPVS